MPKGRLIEVVYRSMGRRGKSDVETFAGNNHPLGDQLDGKLIASTGDTVTDGFFIGPHACVAKGGKRRIVKSAGSREIANGKGEVMKHMHGRV